MLTAILAIGVMILVVSLLSLAGIVLSDDGGQRRDAAARTLDYAKADQLRSRARLLDIEQRERSAAQAAKNEEAERIREARRGRVTRDGRRD